MVESYPWLDVVIPDMCDLQHISCIGHIIHRRLGNLWAGLVKRGLGVARFSRDRYSVNIRAVVRQLLLVI